jgi:glycosyltransferase involved in cell wall biosynthesis
MRILFLQERAYFSWAAGVKINRYLMHGLAELGHDARAVVTLYDPTNLSFDPVTDEHCQVIEDNEKFLCLNDKNTIVVAVRSLQEFADLSSNVICEFQPEIILYSEASDYRNLSNIPEEFLSRCVITVHCAELLPFGPFACFPNKEATKLFRATGGVIVVCQFLRDYLTRYAQKESVVLSFPAYGPGPFKDLSCFEKGLVLMVNASNIKGLPVFLGLARAFPQIEFGVVCSWATTEAALQAIEAVPNIKKVAPNPNIEKVLEQTRILLVPSLWQESFPVTVIEAQLRGVPVIASRVGGLPETKFGTQYVLPVNPIKEWEVQFRPDGISLEPRIPKQDSAPWISALEILLRDREEYYFISRKSRARTCEFVKKIRIETFESYFLNVWRKSDRPSD